MRTSSLILVASSGLLAVVASACSGDNTKNNPNNPQNQITSVLDPTCGVETTVDTTPTYAEVVAPILLKNCANCHYDGGIAPFPLLTYEDAKPLAGLIKDRTTAREMPPYNPNNCGHCNTFVDAKWLTSEEIAIIAAWAEAGAPSGDLTKAPAPPAPPEGLTESNGTWDMGVSYTPNDKVADDYRCFLVDPKLAADQFVTGYEVIPGDPRVVHHVIAYTLESDAAQTQAEALDAQDAIPGYQCYGGPAVNSRFTIGWAPGGGATRFPANTGLRVPGNRKFVMQIHYNVADGAFPDQTKIKVNLAPSVEKEARIEKIAAGNINIPPNQQLFEVTNGNPVPQAAGTVTLWGVAPHMHQTGRTMKITATGSQDQCLLDVGNWDFHWQSFNMFTKPLTVQGGDTVTITCGYNTMGRSTVTTSGESTEDEMCMGFFYVTL
jgi:Copper type II ascorbate-dependent monooxygenase, C-terminal domain/Copper type II ascorbate-dependent monooxygenase, N-terminal domain